jgi:phospholipid transport system substrate-binding protein
MFRPHPARRTLLRATLVLVAVLTPVAPALAAGEAPDALVQSVAADVLKIIQQDRELRAGSQSKMAELIEEKIVPHFDFQRMTRLAVGRNWRQATPAQQKQLVDEFRTLLVRSYSTAYSAYRDIEVEVKPVRLQPSDEDVQVRTLIKLPNGAPPVSVDYSMFKASSSWKVYDVTVDGVSLVTTYRSTFADQVSKGGIDGLVKSLAEMNAAKSAPPPAGVNKQ